MFVCLGFTAYDPCRLFNCLFVWVLRHTILVGYLNVYLFGFYGLSTPVGYLNVCLFLWVLQHINPCRLFKCLFVCLFGFYGVSTLVGNLNVCLFVCLGFTAYDPSRLFKCLFVRVLRHINPV